MKNFLWLVIAGIILTTSVHATAFYFQVNAGGIPSKTDPVQKTWFYPAEVTIRELWFFDLSTDNVYIRVRDNLGNYATDYKKVTSKNTPQKHVFNYYEGKGNLFEDMVLYSNMYTTVPGGYIRISGDWTP